MELSVPVEAVGERLDRFLAVHLGSRAAAERAVTAGALVDGQARPKSFRLAGGEAVSVPDEAPAGAVAPPAEPAIVWEDEHLLVIDKPAGLVVHPGAGHASGTLVDALGAKAGGGEPERRGIVHRLDRDTSGLMVVARSEEAHQRLSALVRTRALERTYLALVQGPAAVPHRPHRGADRPRPGRAHPDVPRHAPRPGTPSRTSRSTGSGRATRCCGCGSRRGGCTRFACIWRRSTCPSSAMPSTACPTRRSRRQFLHASQLAFPHPFSGERIEARSELPPELAAYLDQI